jgi:hypothetical protein
MASKPVSLARQAIATISRDYCAPVLKPLGFRRASPHFWRASTNGLHQSINFQASAWGTHDSGSITINLGVSSPALSMAISERIAKPGTGLWPVQARIGSLMPENRDVWWDIDRQTDIALLGVEILKIVVSYGVPFLECYGTAHVFDDHLLSRYNGHSIGKFPLALVRATLAVQLGDKDRAAILLREQLEDTENEAYAHVVRRLAKELDVSLQPSTGP